MSWASGAKFVFQYRLSTKLRVAPRGATGLSDGAFAVCGRPVHRDIKPENFLLTSPNSFQLKLIDFGLARSFLYDLDEPPSCSGRQLSGRQAPAGFRRDLSGTRETDSSPSVDRPAGSPVSGHHTIGHKASASAEGSFPRSPRGRESVEATERQRLREGSEEGWSRRGYSAFPHHRLVRPLHSLVGTMHFAAPEILSLSVRNLFLAKPSSLRALNKNERFPVEEVRENPKEGKARGACSYLPRKKAGEKEESNDERDKSPKKGSDGGSLAGKELQCMFGYDGRYADSWSCGVLFYLLLSGDLPFTGDSDVEVLQQMLRGAPVFSGAVWQDVSAVAKDLIIRLLTVPPSTRLLPGEALQHPFFRLFLPHSVPLRLYASPGALARRPSFPSFPASSARTESCALLQRALPLASPIMHLSAPAPLNLSTCLSHHSIQFSPLIGLGLSCPGHGFFPAFSSVVSFRDVPTSLSQNSGTQLRYDLAASRDFKSGRDHSAVWAFRRCRSESSICCTCCSVREQTGVYQQQFACPSLPLLPGGVFPGNVVRRPSLYMSGGSSPGTAELLSLTHQLSDVSIDTFSQSSPRGDDEQEFSKFLVRAESATQKPVVPHSTGITLNSVPHSGSSGVHVARSVAAFKAHRQALPPCGSVPHLLGRGVAGHCGGEAGADSQSAATKKKKGRKKEGALEAAALISRLTEDSSVLVAPSASGRGRHEGPAAFLYLPGGCEFQRKVTLPQGERELSETNLAQHEWQQTHEDIAEEIGDGGDVFALSTAYICWCRAPAGRHQQADSHSQQHQLQRLDSGTATNAHHGEGAKSWQEKSSSCQTTEVQRRANGKREEEKAEMESERWESRAGKERRGSGSSCSSGQSGAEQDDSDCSSEVSEVKTEAEPEEPLPPAVSAAFSFPAVAVPPVFHPRAAHLRSSYPAGDLASDPSSPSSDAPRSGAADALLLAPPVCVGKCPSNSAGRDRSSSASSDDSAADESAVAGVSSSAVVAAALQFQQPCAPFFPLGEMLDPPPVVTEGCLIASDKQVLVYSPRTTTAAAIAAVRSVQTPNLAASRLSRKINQDLYGLEKVCGASLSPARGTADPDIGKTGRPGGSASGMPAPTAITGPLLDFSVPSAGQTLEGRAERGQAVATTERRQGKPAMVGGSPALLGTNCLCALHQTAIQAGTEAAAATLMAIGGVYVDARSIRLRAAAGDEADSRSQSEGSGDVPVLRLPQHPLSSILSTRSRMLSGRWTSPPECPHTSPGRDASMCGRGAAIPYDFPGTQAVFSSPDCLDGLSKRQEQELSYLLCFPIPHIHVPCANPSPAANSSEPLRRQESAANFSTSRAGDGSSTGVPHRSQLWLLSPQDVKLFPFCPLAPVLFQRWIVYSQKSLLQKKCALLVVEMARGDLANAALTASGPSGRSVSAILGGRGMSRHSSSNVAASAGGRNTSFSRGLYGSSAPLSFPAEKLEGSDCAMEQLQRLEGLFLLLDGDGDGLLTLRELVTGVQRLSLLLRVKLKVDRARKKEAQNLLRLRRERLEEVANEVSAAEAVLQRQKEFLLSCAKFASSKSSTVSAVVKHKGRASIIGEGSPAAKSGSERGGSARPRDPDSPRFVDGEPEEGCTEQGGLGHERPDRAREERRRRRMRLLKMCGEEAGLAQMESCLRECDANKDGVIDLTEFLTACADERLFVRQELLRAAFRKLDFEGRGFLSVEEVKSALGWGDGTAVVAEINATKSRWVPERTGQCEGHEHEAPEKQLQSAELGAPRFTFEDFVACLQAP
ncbi:cam cdpk [Cystoisospora suis]|uniref:Cam cdpk n=1 Tax=Cystoisospora suis TaxID=483139 RepID=A0A2C6LEC4_9APIC|nr:cam cdpk [Cystoisospora suis]